ncbi:hypothetical protein EOM09_03145 [bacterium]|nr:hypothetical protein [bacterium]
MERNVKKRMFLESELLNQILSGKKTLGDLNWFIQLSDYEIKKAQNRPVDLFKSMEEHFHYVDQQILNYLNEQKSKTHLSKHKKLFWKKNPKSILKQKMVTMKDALCIALDFITERNLLEVEKGASFLIPFSREEEKGENEGKIFYFHIFNSSDWSRPKIELGKQTREDFSRIYLKSGSYFLINS